MTLAAAFVLLLASVHTAPALDELWRDATLWEVGSNAEKVPDMSATATWSGDSSALAAEARSRAENAPGTSCREFIVPRKAER